MKKLVIIATLVAAILAASATSAAASPRRDRTSAPTATFSRACDLVISHTDNYASFSECVRALARGNDPLLQAAAEIACPELEAGGLTYPYTFYGDVPPEELPEGWPLLRANNSRQCAIALFTYHSIAPAFFPEGGA